MLYTEISDQILEEEGKQSHIFDLLFKVYYTKYDFVSVEIKTYLRPKEEDQLKPHHRFCSFFHEDEAIFICNITSDYLFQGIKHHLNKSYKAKSYLDRYGFVPISVSTFNYQTECIDFLLTQEKQRLSDFLHSQYNTNEVHETRE